MWFLAPEGRVGGIELPLAMEQRPSGFMLNRFVFTPSDKPMYGCLFDGSDLRAIVIWITERGSSPSPARGTRRSSLVPPVGKRMEIPLMVMRGS